MLTAPNRLASVRTFSTMLYPEALVEGAQFSVRDLALECMISGNELTVVPEDAHGVIGRCSGRRSRIGQFGVWRGRV